MLTPEVIPLDDPQDPRLADYVSLTDVALRSRHEPAKGLYIAESSTVLGRALAAGHRPRSVLVSPRWLADLTDMLARAVVGPGGREQAADDASAVPVYVAEPEVLEAITGFHVHRGALAAMHRPPLRSVAEVLAAARGGTGARRVAVLEDVVDHTNVGAAFRSAAALGVDAVLVTPRCADPLYRRSVRVSMGTVFQVPWTRVDPWPEGVRMLREAGFVTAALALTQDAVPLDHLELHPPERLALVLGTEGDGLRPSTVAAADLVVRIPMAGAVDSLNVAAAAAVAFWATRVRDASGGAEQGTA
ncbi:RNA methyltransferase [Actinotalea sp. Marseille-Q4924]|uniref:TrmH family RNA methyltransferase n=1 Tax=Actinotalea sp. Marseille-Q4924 TaxID=2866571 RepID=UPI001CE4476F|nr:RNA methyltransferase [Actinotalea sp. Marseille-Q4924]